MRSDRSRSTRPRRARRVPAGLAAVALIALVGLGAVLATGNRDGADGDPGGEPVPDTQLVDFDDEPVRLDDFTDRPLVVNFFASWCPPCVAEMRDALGPVHQEIGDEVAFLGVAMQDTRAEALGVVDETGVTYDLADDPDGELFAELGLGGMPATVYVDADGDIVDRHIGSLTRSQLEGQIEESLSP